MKTALDWYCKEMNYLKINYTIGNIDENEYLIKQVQIYQQAKQIMKQQIIDAWCNALDLNASEYAEQYYKETFKSE